MSTELSGTKLDSITRYLPDSVIILFVLRNDNLEEYLSLKEGYFLITEYPVKELYKNSQEVSYQLLIDSVLKYTISEKIALEKLQIQQTILDMQYVTNRTIILLNADQVPSFISFCCSLCGGVHSALGLSSLDCLCCAFGCDFACRFEPTL